MHEYSILRAVEVAGERLLLLRLARPLVSSDSINTSAGIHGVVLNGLVLGVTGPLNGRLSG